MMKSLLQKPSNLAQKPVTPLKNSFLRAVIEGFADGVLILTSTGDPLHINQRGLHLCRQISPDPINPKVPEPIWALCQYLFEGEFSSERPTVLSSTILTPVGTIRARVQWFQFEDGCPDCLMITLEDQAYAAKTSALFEARQFNLTERETEVWVLRKTNYSYEAIADELYITTNTVKRHLKSIYAKRKQVLDLEEA